MNKIKSTPGKEEEFEIKLWFITIKAKNPTLITVAIVLAVLLTLLLLMFKQH